GVQAADADAHDVDEPESEVWTAEERSNVVDGQPVARDTVVGEDHGGGNGTVVDLVHAGGRHGERARGYGGGRVGDRVLHEVVAGVGAADVDADDGDLLGRTDILVGKEGVVIVGDQLVPCEAVIRERDRVRQSAVVDAVLSRGRHRQGPAGDGGGRVGG